MKRCYFCQDRNVVFSYEDKHPYGVHMHTYRICQRCAPRGLDLVKCRYEVFILDTARGMGLEIYGKDGDQTMKHIKQLRPIELWVKTEPFYKFFYDSAMDSIDGPLGQFTKAVKME